MCHSVCLSPMYLSFRPCVCEKEITTLLRASFLPCIPHGFIESLIWLHLKETLCSTLHFLTVLQGNYHPCLRLYIMRYCITPERLSTLPHTACKCHFKVNFLAAITSRLHSHSLPSRQVTCLDLPASPIFHLPLLANYDVITPT